MLKAFHAAVETASLRSQIPADVGDGMGNIAVPGQNLYVYVRILQNGTPVTTVIALNTLVSPAYNLPVMLKRTPAGDYQVIGPDANRIATWTSTNITGIGVGPHSHRIGSPLFEMTEGRRVEPGFVGVGTGLIVTILPTFVSNGTAQGYVAIGTLDLTGSVPGSAGNWCWAKIGADPTGVLVVATSTPQSVSTPLTEAQLAAIPMAAGVSPMCGVKLTNGETDITVASDFLDCRNWINAAGSGNVVGPGSATDHAVARYDGTTGQLLEDSGATLSDAGVLALPAGLSTAFAKVGGAIADHYTTVGNTTVLGADDTLYTDTLAANIFGSNGDKISAFYGGSFVSSATATREVKTWFAGTAIFDTGALTLSLSAAWTMYVEIIRVSATVVRYMVSFATEGAALAAYTAVGELTGLTLSGTNILKITGAANGVAAAANDITAKLGSISWDSAA